MKQGWKRSAVIATLVAALAAGALMTACSGGGEDPATETDTRAEATVATPETGGKDDGTKPVETDTSTAGAPDTATDPGESGTTPEPATKGEPGSSETEPETETEPGTAVVPSDGDQPATPTFSDEWTAMVEVEKSREITVARPSNRIKITGEGSFTVTYTAADGEKTLTSENGAITLENSSTVHIGMVLTVKVEAKTVLTLALEFDKGAEENPYDVAEGANTTVTFTKETYIRIPKTGWYSLAGEDVELTNYSLADDRRVFLPAGVHGLSSRASGEVSVTITPLETPVGYDQDDPVAITELGREHSLTLYSGVKLYFSYTAEEAGLYEISLGSAGKSQNSRFAISTEDYKTYYGRYYSEDGEWLSCPGGKTVTVFLKAGEAVTIAADYTLEENMIGDDALAILVKPGEGAIDLKDGEGSGELAKGGELIFRFTAPEAGAYEASLGLGATNKACRFTTSLDDGVYYGSDCDSDTKLLRLEKGQVVYFLVDSPSEAAGSVMLLVGEAAEQPWPEGIKTGTYVGKSLELVVDRDSRQLSLNGSAKVRGFCAEGIITFSIGVEGAGSQDYTLKLAENGTDLELSWVKTTVSEEDETVIRTLTFQEEVEPIAISLWEGVYTATAEDGTVTKLTIYKDGSGLFGTTRYDITDSGCTYTDRNVLQWQIAYTMTIAEQDETGKVTKISAVVHGQETPVLFTLTDEPTVPLPTTLPIQVDDTFPGSAGFLLYFQGSYQYFNDRVFDIVAYDEASKTYTIAGYDTAAGDDKAPASYRLTFKDEETIEVYDLEGKLLDTLVKAKPVEIPDLQANGKQETSLAVDDAGRIYLRVTKDGWYTFTSYGEHPAEIFTDCTVPDTGKPSADADSKKTVSTTSGLLLQLSKGTVICIYGEASAVYSATEPVAEVGSEKNPHAMEGNTLEVTDLIDGSRPYYVSYTAKTAGTYEIGFNIDKMHFVVKGQEYGRVFTDLSWADCAGGLVCKLELAAGDTVVIQLNRPTSSGDDAIIGVAPEGTLKAELAAAVSANLPTAVTSFTEAQQGTYGYGSYQLTLNANGKADLIMEGGEISEKGATVIRKGDTYSFTYDYYGNDLTAKFSFNADGSIHFLSSPYDNYVTLTLGGGGATEGIFTDEEQGYWADADGDYMMIIEADSVTLSIGDYTEYTVTAEELSTSLDGLYWQFTCEAGDVSFRLHQTTDGTYYIHLTVGDKIVDLNALEY